MSGIQVTVELNRKEEVADLLDSAGWDFLCDIVEEDCRISRRVLLTGNHGSSSDHHVSKLKTYKNFVESAYQAAGRKLPSHLRELFTGDTHE